MIEDQHAIQFLGQRIVQAARLAVSMHLADVLLDGDDGLTRREDYFSSIGGADLDSFTDEALPCRRAADDRPFRSSDADAADGGAG